MGADIVRYNRKTSAELRRDFILKNIDANVVLDIGANKGTYAAMLRKHGYANKIISFEPLSEPFALLQQEAQSDPLWTAKNAAVGDQDGETTINVSGHQTSSSLLPISSMHTDAMPSSAYVTTEKINIVRLDTVLPTLTESSDRIFAKIDVQGYEQYVLAGAQQSLPHIQGLEMELSLVPLYEGAPSYLSMLEQLNAAGFQLVSFEPVFQDANTGYLLQADGIFIRRD